MTGVDKSLANVLEVVRESVVKRLVNLASCYLIFACRLLLHCRFLFVIVVAWSLLCCHLPVVIVLLLAGCYHVVAC